MHSALQFVAGWLMAYLSLALALALLNIYCGIIGNDLELNSFGSEAAVAAVASLIEGASVWLMVSYVPAATKGLLIPALIVALIYKTAHFEDWTSTHVVMLLVFQAVIAGAGVALVFGHFQAALGVLIAFAAALTVLAAVLKNIAD